MTDEGRNSVEKRTNSEDMESSNVAGDMQESSTATTNNKSGGTTLSGDNTSLAYSSNESPTTGAESDEADPPNENKCGNSENITSDKANTSTESTQASEMPVQHAEQNISGDIKKKAHKASISKKETDTEAKASSETTVSVTESKKTTEDKKKTTKPEDKTKFTKIPADPDAIKLKFLFANRDGLNVMVECKTTDSVGEIKGVLLSMWPDVLSPCSEGDRIRLICMGKGILMPDSKSLKDCEIPVFKTHATPINVSVRPEFMGNTSSKRTLFGGTDSHNNTGSSFGNNSTPLLGGGGIGSGRNGNQQGVRQGCSCVIS